MPTLDDAAGAASGVEPIFGAAAAERLLRAPRAAVRPVLRLAAERPLVERLAVERLAVERLAERLAGFFAVDFFAAGFFAADRDVVEREVDRLVAFFAVDFFAAGFFAADRDAVEREVDRLVAFFAVDFFAAGFFAADLPPLRPADFALDLAVAFLVPEGFEDLPADLPLDAFLPAAAMSRSFLGREEMMH